MNLYLVQHAEAKTEEEDKSRPLSDKGIENLEKIGGYLSKIETIRPSIIYHSGKKRALETAEKLSQVLKPEEAVKAEQGLAPNDNPEIWMDRINQMDSDCLIVGHLPHLSKLAAKLICNGADLAKQDIIVFQNAGVVCLIRTSENNWGIKWILIPELLN